MLERVIDTGFQGEIELLLHNGGKKDYVWSAGDPLQHLLVLLSAVVKVNGKLQHPKPGTTTKGTDPSGMRLWVTLPGKESRPVELLA